MRETHFIEQKKEKWIQLERTLQQANPDPDTMNDLFVQVTDDLSYARTFYPNRSVRVYLNGIAQRIFSSIYKNKKRNSQKLLSFWTKDLPLILYQSRWELLLAMLLFWIPFIMGCLSGSIGEEEEFARQLLGDDYIDMTLANIQSGDPMAVYKDQSPFAMFFYIWLNNTAVCFRFFIMGALFMVGSVMELVFWGLYVGAFQYFFYEQGELMPSILGIWTHGSLEIPASILVGAAGIILGKGLVFPGSYSRMEAFLISARRGIKVMIGTLPVIFIAAVVESYITRLTDTPNILRASFIVLNFLIIFLYFVLYPYLKFTKNARAKLPLILGISAGITLLTLGILFATGTPDAFIIALMTYVPVAFLVLKIFALLGHFEEKSIVEEEEVVLSPNKEHLRFGQIKSSGELFKDTFIVFRKHFASIVGVVFLTASIYTSIVFLLSQGEPSELFSYPADFANIMGIIYTNIAREGVVSGIIVSFFQVLVNLLQAASQFLHYKNGFLDIGFWTNSVVYAILSYACLTFLKKEYYKSIHNKYTSSRSKIITQFFGVLLITILFNAVLGLGNTYPIFYFIAFVIFPFFLVWAATYLLEGKNPSTAFVRAWKLISTKIFNSVGLYMTLGIVILMIWSLFFSPILMFLIRNFGYNFSLSQEGMDELLVIVITFLAQTMFGFISALIIIGFGLLYYSQIEIKEAKTLRTQIQMIGSRKKIRGLEREG